MDFDQIDSGETASPEMKRAARQEIIGCAADGLDSGAALDWRAAVQRHPFFAEVTNAAQQQGEELGKVMGTAMGILDIILDRHNDDEGAVESADWFALATSLLKKLSILRDLYLRSPVPSQGQLRAALVENGELHVEDLGDMDEDEDDGSVATSLLSSTLHTLLLEIKRGCLKASFKAWGASTHGRSVRAASMQILEAYVDQNRPAVRSGANGVAQQRLDDW